MRLQGFGVIGDSAEGPQEVEGEPALSLTLGVLPGVCTFYSAGRCSSASSFAVDCKALRTCLQAFVYFSHANVMAS